MMPGKHNKLVILLFMFGSLNLIELFEIHVHTFHDLVFEFPVIASSGLSRNQDTNLVTMPGFLYKVFGRYEPPLFPDHSVTG